MAKDGALGGLAVVTGASTGIGLELARLAAEDGYNLLIVADEKDIEGAAQELRAQHGVEVTPLQIDLAPRSGVEKLIAAIGDRPVNQLIDNASRGLGRAFLDQDLDDAQLVIDLNISSTVRLIHVIGNSMQRRIAGRILI